MTKLVNGFPRMMWIYELLLGNLRHFEGYVLRRVLGAGGGGDGGASTLLKKGKIEK